MLSVIYAMQRNAIWYLLRTQNIPNFIFGLQDITGRSERVNIARGRWFTLVDEYCPPDKAYVNLDM